MPKCGHPWLAGYWSRHREHHCVLPPNHRGPHRCECDALQQRPAPEAEVSRD